MCVFQSRLMVPRHPPKPPEKRPKKVKFTFAKERDDRMVCEVCGEKSTSHCGRCKVVAYCSRQCQELHWNQHKMVCKREVTLESLIPKIWNVLLAGKNVMEERRRYLRFISVIMDYKDFMEKWKLPQRFSGIWRQLGRSCWEISRITTPAHNAENR